LPDQEYIMTAMKKPTIGLNLSNCIEDGPTPAMKINDDYVDAVIAAGGLPLLIPQVEDESGLGTLLGLCDGFVLTGGYDYDPLSWGEKERHPSVQLCDERRQKSDMLLIKLLLQSKLPVLGICGGHQLINIGTGGTLYQDIFSDSDFSGVLPHRHAKGEIAHDVMIEPDSRLHSITAKDVLAVNSTHHMAVKRTGRGLAITARSSDGCIEAVESTDQDRFILGVQWHPEAMIRVKANLDIFRILIKESGKAGRGSAPAPHL